MVKENLIMCLLCGNRNPQVFNIYDGVWDVKCGCVVIDGWKMWTTRLSRYTKKIEIWNVDSEEFVPAPTSILKKHGLIT